MKLLLVWLLLCLLALGGIALVLYWVTGEPLQKLLGSVMDRRFVLGAITTMVVVVSLLGAIACCSGPWSSGL